MIVIDNVKIYRLDKYCYSFDYVKKVTKKETGKVEEEWFSSKRYFGTLIQTLEAVKEYLLKEKIELDVFTPQQFIKEIENLKDAIIKIDLKIREEE